MRLKIRNVAALVACLLFLGACSLPIFQSGSDEQKALRDEIQEQYVKGNISQEVRDGMLAALDSVASFADAKEAEFDWQKLLAALFGIGGTVLGGAGALGARRAAVALQARGPAKPLGPEEVKALKAILGEKMRS